METRSTTKRQRELKPTSSRQGPGGSASSNHLGQVDPSNRKHCQLELEQGKLGSNLDSENLATLQKKLNEERAQLEGDRKQLDEDRDKLVEERKQLNNDRDNLVQCQQELAKDREKFVQKQQELKNDRIKLEKHRQELDENRDKLALDQQELQKDRDKLAKDRHELSKDCDTLTQGKLDLGLERDKVLQLQLEIEDHRNIQMNTLQHENDKQAQERHELEREREKVTQIRLELEQERDQLVQDRVKLETQSKKLSKDRFELEEKLNKVAQEPLELKLERDKLEQLRLVLEQQCAKHAQLELELQNKRERLVLDRSQLEEEMKQHHTEQQDLIADRQNIELEWQQLHEDRNKLDQEIMQFDDRRMQFEAFQPRARFPNEEVERLKTTWEELLLQERRKTAEAILSFEKVRDDFTAYKKSHQIEKGRNIRLQQKILELQSSVLTLNESLSQEKARKKRRILKGGKTLKTTHRRIRNIIESDTDEQSEEISEPSPSQIMTVGSPKSRIEHHEDLNRIQTNQLENIDERAGDNFVDHGIPLSYSQHANSENSLCQPDKNDQLAGIECDQNVASAFANEPTGTENFLEWTESEQQGDSEERNHSDHYETTEPFDTVNSRDVPARTNRTHKATSKNFSPVTCPICEVVFFNQSSLNRHHRLQHSTEKASLHCPRCGQAFTRRDNRKAHMKRKKCVRKDKK